MHGVRIANGHTQCNAGAPSEERVMTDNGEQIDRMVAEGLRIIGLSQPSSLGTLPLSSQPVQPAAEGADKVNSAYKVALGNTSR